MALRALNLLSFFDVVSQRGVVDLFVANGVALMHVVGVYLNRMIVLHVIINFLSRDLAVQILLYVVSYLLGKNPVQFLVSLEI